jgi:hypothetical protein
MQAERWFEPPELDEALLVTQSPGASVLIASRNGNSPKAMVATEWNAV